MEPGVSTEVVTGDDDASGMGDVGESLAGYIAQRRAEHPEWYNDQEPSEASIESQEQPEPAKEAAAEVEAEDEQAGSEDPKFVQEAQKEATAEPESKALKRILSREAKLREDKTAFETEQKEFKDKLAQYEAAKKHAEVDPIGYLQTLGVTQEKLTDIARAAYYESLGDSAPDEYKGQKESLALKRRLAELEARLEAKEAAPEKGANKEAFKAYQDSMIEATKTFDTEKFPSVARVVDAYSEADVAADMFAVAQSYAEQMNGQGAALTPEQCMAEVENRYSQLLGKLSPAQDSKAAAAPAPKSKKPAKKTLSNSMSSNVPPEKSLDDLSYDEVAAAARANFFKTMQGG